MYSGKGTFQSLVSDASKVMDAIGGAKVELPADVSGEAYMKVKGSGKDSMLELDLSDVPVFSTNNVRFIIPDGGVLDSSSVKVEGGVLKINVAITV